MLDILFKNRAHERRRLRSQAADVVLGRVGRERVVVLDDDLADACGVSRRVLFRIVSDLAIKERLHLLAGPDGVITLLANAEFRRATLVRCGVDEAEADALAEETQVVEAVEAAPVSRAATGPVLRRAVDQALGRAAAEPAPTACEPAEDDIGWFTLEVARPRREKVPAGRQSLPERQRQPWGALEGAGLD